MEPPEEVLSFLIFDDEEDRVLLLLLLSKTHVPFDFILSLSLFQEQH
jgi:hypothetical protein